MKIKTNIIKVVFLLKPKAPVNLKPMTYFAETNNYTTAHERSLAKLESDIDEELLHYYSDVAMSEIEII